MSALIDVDRRVRALCSGFLRSAAAFPDRPSVEVNGEILSYRVLHQRASAIAATLAKHAPLADPPLTAVFAYRSATAFAGVLAALLRGHGYVPLNRTFPPERSRQMLQRSRCRALVVDSGSESQLPQLVAEAEEQLVLLFPERDDVTELASRYGQHVVLGRNDLEEAEQWSPPGIDADAIAYLLFTSGSTGIPKGVMVAQRNLNAYVDWTVRHYGVNENDRVSQTFDMTFDLSAHDMFVAWETGACICCPTQKQIFKPDRFINDSALTIWFSVPSTALFMRRMGLLKPGAYPKLRLSLFCGEALPMQTAADWGAAAANSIVENIYGPTELTIACTAYRWDAQRSPAECEQGVVPIGEPFAGMEARIVDESLREVPPGSDGELIMTGPQLTLGYWEDEEKTRGAFVIPPDEDRTFYRTGDRVRRRQGGPILYLGRIDNQVKILGHRVELGEIESKVREASGVEGVVALGWPMTSSGADGIEAFVQTDALDTKAVLDVVRTTLPPYMVPRSLRLLPRFPLNANGKFDRKALQQILETTV